MRILSSHGRPSPCRTSMVTMTTSSVQANTNFVWRTVHSADAALGRNTRSPRSHTGDSDRTPRITTSRVTEATTITA